jgi:hypothetical protein
MSIWWNNLSGFEQFFWTLAIPFSALFIVQMILLVIGIEHVGDISDIHGNASLDINHELDIGNHLDSNVPLKLVTLRNVTIFFTIFSWTGIMGVRNNYGKPMTLVLGLMLGSSVVLLLNFVFRSVLKLTESGNMDLKYAIGEVGDVYLTIPGNEKRGGKVQVIFQSSLKELEAITYGDKLVTGTKIIVVGVEDDYLVVKALEDMNKGELL